MLKGMRIVGGSLAAVVIAISWGCSDSISGSGASAGGREVNELEERQTAQVDVDLEDTAETGEPDSQYRTVENATLPAPGTDPLAMIFELRQADGEAIGSEQIRVSYPTLDQAVVVWVQRGLADDSVSAMRTRYELRAVNNPDGQQLWQVVNVTQQNKCHADRGSQDWTGALCR
jgi:hypothetical protein